MIADETTIDTARNPFEKLCDKDDAALALSMVKREREMKVLVLRFGLDGSPPKTLREIGKMFGVTGSRIRHLECRALRQIRRPRDAKSYDQFCELGSRFFDW